MDRKTFLIFSQRIRKLRNHQKLSQEKTADLLNVSRGYYGAIERGDQYPRLDMLYHLAKIFNLPLHQLLYFESKDSEQIAFIKENQGPYSTYEHWFANCSLDEQKALYFIFEQTKKLWSKH